VANESKDEPINWKLLITCCAGGAVLIGIALCLQTEWGWGGVVTDTLVEAGVAGVFVGVAFLFERAFVRKVTNAAASAADATFARRTEQMEARIQDLTKEVRAQEQADVEAQNKLITALDSPTLANIDAAMQEATKVGGLAEEWIKVTASPDRDTLSLRFARSKSNDGKPALAISIRLEKNAKAHPTDLVPVMWTEKDKAGNIGHSISAAIKSRRLLNSLEEFDWSIAMANLKDSMEVAIKSHGMDAGDWNLNGGLYELLGNGWAVSSAGLEHREPAYLLPQRDLIFAGGRPAYTQPKKDLRPQWCSESDWKWLVGRAMTVDSILG